MSIAFNKPPFTGHEERHVLNAMKQSHISGDGIFTQKCERWFESEFRCHRALLTPSCTAALEMVALLIDIQPGDEVIMPSYTFVSTANAFALRGAQIVFVDIRPDTMNIDETLIEAAITDKTKAIVPVHYAGVSCDMDAIMAIAKHHQLWVIEDAAQAIESYSHGQRVGTQGHLSAFSFHETKNVTSGGEGGCLVINDERLVQRAEIIREKGTNRSQFFHGQVDKYTWVDLGGSHLMSELQAAFLWAQLQALETITQARLNSWNAYHQGLESLEQQGYLERPTLPNNCQHNAHLYAIRVESLAVRTQLLAYLKEQGIGAVFHYVPLHSSPAGQKFGRFHGDDVYTTSLSERLIRLPIWYGLTQEQLSRVIEQLYNFPFLRH